VSVGLGAIVVSSSGTTVLIGINGAAVAMGAAGAGAGASVGIGVVGGGGVAANGGATGVTTGVASGADIADRVDTDGGGGPVGKADGPPDIIFENAIGSIPGGMGIPAISAAAMISAAVGSTVPVM